MEIDYDSVGKIADNDDLLSKENDYDKENININKVSVEKEIKELVDSIKEIKEVECILETGSNIEINKSAKNNNSNLKKNSNKKNKAKKKERSNNKNKLTKETKKISIGKKVNNNINKKNKTNTSNKKECKVLEKNDKSINNYQIESNSIIDNDNSNNQILCELNNNMNNNNDNLVNKNNVKKEKAKNALGNKQYCSILDKSYALGEKIYDLFEKYNQLRNKDLCDANNFEIRSLGDSSSFKSKKNNNKFENNNNNNTENLDLTSISNITSEFSKIMESIRKEIDKKKEYYYLFSVFNCFSTFENQFLNIKSVIESGNSLNNDKNINMNNSYDNDNGNNNKNVYRDVKEELENISCNPLLHNGLNSSLMLLRHYNLLKLSNTKNTDNNDIKNNIEMNNNKTDDNNNNNINKDVENLKSFQSPSNKSKKERKKSKDKENNNELKKDKKNKKANTENKENKENKAKNNIDDVSNEVSFIKQSNDNDSIIKEVLNNNNNPSSNTKTKAKNAKKNKEKEDKNEKNDKNDKNNIVNNKKIDFFFQKLSSDTLNERKKENKLIEIMTDLINNKKQTEITEDMLNDYRKIDEEIVEVYNKIISLVLPEYEAGKDKKSFFSNLNFYFKEKEILKNKLKQILKKHDKSNVNSRDQQLHKKIMTNLTNKASNTNNDAVYKRCIFIEESNNNDFRNKITKQAISLSYRNPFKKDETVLNYDMDSDEERNEYNAEDIASEKESKNNNSEDSDQDSDNSNDDGNENNKNKWVVSDDYLSEDEVEEEARVKVNIKESYINKLLDIRPNYIKPIVVEIVNSSNNSNTCSTNAKSEMVKSLFTAKTFKIKNILINKNNRVIEDHLDMDYEEHGYPKFPVNCSVMQEKKVMFNEVDDLLKEIVLLTHYSFENSIDTVRDNVFGMLKLKRKDVEAFFKDNVVKSRCPKTNQKMFVISNSIINKVNISQAELASLHEKNRSKLEIKEKRELNALQDKLNELEINYSINNTKEIDANNTNNIVDLTLDIQVPETKDIINNINLEYETQKARLLLLINNKTKKLNQIQMTSIVPNVQTKEGNILKEKKKKKRTSKGKKIEKISNKVKNSNTNNKESNNDNKDNDNKDNDNIDNIDNYNINNISNETNDTNSKDNKLNNSLILNEDLKKTNTKTAKKSNNNKHKPSVSNKERLDNFFKKEVKINIENNNVSVLQQNYIPTITQNKINKGEIDKLNKNELSTIQLLNKKRKSPKSIKVKERSLIKLKSKKNLNNHSLLNKELQSFNNNNNNKTIDQIRDSYYNNYCNINNSDNVNRNINLNNDNANYIFSSYLSNTDGKDRERSNISVEYRKVSGNKDINLSSLNKDNNKSSNKFAINGSNLFGKKNNDFKSPQSNKSFNN